MFFLKANEFDSEFYLNYNIAMKKIFLLCIILLCSSPSAFSQEKKAPAFKQMFAKKLVIEQKGTLVEAAKPATNDAMTPAQQANLFYSSNEIKKSFDVLLTIPDEQRTAQEWLLLGNILQDQERISDAIFMYQRAILIDPKYYKAYYNLANIYLEEEKPFLAIENYRKANKAKNDFPYAYYNLGCAYIQAGELKKAKIAFLKAIELNKNDPDFYYNLAYTYKKLNKPQLSKQYLEIYNKALEARSN